MRASHIAARAVLVCSAAGIVCALWSAVDDTPAHADDRGLLPAVELDLGLVDTATSTVEQLPHTVTTLTEPVRPRRLVEHTRGTVEQARSTLDEVIEPARAVAPVDVPDLLADPKPAEPAKPAKFAKPAKPAKPAPAEPAPAPTTYTVTTPEADFIAPTVAQLCDHRPAPPRSIPPPAPAPTGPHIPDGQAADAPGAMKPPPKTGDQLAAATPSGPATLALRLLGELLPRSDLSIGRTAPPEPGPA